MARPKKIGLGYFPLDVVLEDDVELLEAEYGLAGFAILVKLWQKIYANGYYIDWKDDNALLFSRKLNTELTLVNDVINCCFKRNLFSKEMYDTYKILTSEGIQKRYLQACSTSRRKNFDLENAYNLVNTEKTSVNSEETPSKPELTPAKSTQSKVNKSKVNESIYINTPEEINSEKTPVEIREAFFQKCWSMYPEQIGLTKITDQDKDDIFRMGDEFIRCIERYIETTEIKRENGFTTLNYQHGSTFFSGGYVDFLDNTYKPVERKKPKDKGNSFHNFEQHTDKYSNDELEAILGIRKEG